MLWQYGGFLKLSLGGLQEAFDSSFSEEGFYYLFCDRTPPRRIESFYIILVWNRKRFNCLWETSYLRIPQVLDEAFSFDLFWCVDDQNYCVIFLWNLPVSLLLLKPQKLYLILSSGEWITKSYLFGSLMSAYNGHGSKNCQLLFHLIRRRK